MLGRKGLMPLMLKMLYELSCLEELRLFERIIIDLCEFLGISEKRLNLALVKPFLYIVIGLTFGHLL